MITPEPNIDEIFKLYYRPLCLYILHYVNNTDTAEDIAQDCFTAFWEKINEGDRIIENVKAYLYATARNRSIDYLKARPSFISLSAPTDLEETLTDDKAEECSCIEARMWTAIDALPERCREVFLLHKRDGMKYKDIAERFHISVNTVDNHISKALRLVRDGARRVYFFIFN